MIAAGKVSVNGVVAQVGQRVDPTKDSVTVNGKPVTATASPVYILVNKPVGIVSTTSDEHERKTVLDLLPKKLHSELGRIYPVGRLDIESEGLLLLTNDGALAQKLTHPSFGIPKTYQVQIERMPSYRALSHLRRGVKLKEGYTQPAEVEVLPKDSTSNDVWLEVTITEGKNRQVRRMMDRVGYPVLRLIRVKFGPYSLDDLGDQVYVVLSHANFDID